MTDTSIAPGTYIIYNRALDPNGNKLAITFLSQGPAAEVQPLESSAIQTWIVGTSGTTVNSNRVIVPTTAQNFQLGGGPPEPVVVVSGRGSVYVITPSADGYIIRNSANDPTTTWGINVVSSPQINFSQDTDAATQRWIFEAVPSQ